MRRIALVSVITMALLLTSGGLAFADDADPAPPSPTPSPSVPPPPVAPTPAPDCRGAHDTRTSAQRRKPFTVCTVAVFSKNHRVTSKYRPHLVSVAVPTSGISRVRMQRNAAVALKKMFRAAKKAGHRLTVRSAYRSYATQKRLYRSDKVLTAAPGASEHQSGLAVDLAARRKGRLLRGYQFGTSKAGRWVKKHAAEFGFILRYPNHQRKITKIPFEPWHFRYVGTAAAVGVAKTSTHTLERYLKITA